VGFGGDWADLLKMLLHGLDVGVKHQQGRAEDVGILIALIGDLARACAFRSPLINLTILLANPRFVLKP
jgi:hypothetical protein